MCTANAAIQDVAVTSTQTLIPQAVFEADSKPCMWLRGILPTDTILPSLPIPPTDTTIVKRINDNSRPIPDWNSGTYYGDGSGGEYSSFPLIRRCGVGLCSIDGIMAISQAWHLSTFLGKYKQYHVLNILPFITL